MTWEEYEEAALAYSKTLTLEDYMESTAQALQRAITLACLGLLRGQVRDFHLFNELLVQYFFNGTLRRVVPDNMVVLGPLASRADRGSFAVELETSPPFLTMEYVSRHSGGKDYVETFGKYERELKVPYYLLFDPTVSPPVLHLYRHGGQAYQEVPANAEGRMGIPELELEVGLADGWVRYWFRGDLLPLPEELLERLTLQEERIEELDQRIEGLETAIGQRDKKLAEMASVLRPLVESRARQAGRADVLAGLTSADAGQLTRWLAELG
jgi:Uma2 family endonuclease